MYAKLRKYTVAILLVVLIVFFCMASQGFASWNNLFNLLRQVAILGIVSTGMSMIIITGNIDLSVGSLLSFISCVVTIMIGQLDFSPVAACTIGIVLSVAAMVVNGAIIKLTNMPAMLCTLAAMQIYQGLTYVVTGAVPVYGLPDSMRMIGQGYFGFIPIPVIIMIGAFLIGGFILSKTYLGRHIYAIGSNPEAARLSGVPVLKTSLMAYAICGLAVGVASIIQMSRLFGGFPTAGSGLEMDVITAVVVGGVSFVGGSGKISGVMQGVLLMGVLSNGLNIMGASTYIQLVVKGAVLILVVGLDCYQKTRQKSAKMSIPPHDVITEN